MVHKEYSTFTELVMNGELTFLHSRNIHRTIIRGWDFHDFSILIKSVDY